MGEPSESSYSFQAVYCVIIGIPNVILVLEKSQFLTVVHILTDLLVPELLWVHSFMLKREKAFVYKGLNHIKNNV